MARATACTSLAFPLAIALLVAEAHAQPSTKVRQVGHLIYGSPASLARRTEALRTGLLDLGHVEGKNISNAFRSAGAANGLPEAGADLVRLNVDVIFATSSAEVEAARRATKTNPHRARADGRTSMRRVACASTPCASARRHDPAGREGDDREGNR